MSLIGGLNSSSGGARNASESARPQPRVVDGDIPDRSFTQRETDDQQDTSKAPSVIQPVEESVQVSLSDRQAPAEKEPTYTVTPPREQGQQRPEPDQESTVKSRPSASTSQPGVNGLQSQNQEIREANSAPDLNVDIARSDQNTTQPANEPTGKSSSIDQQLSLSELREIEKLKKQMLEAADNLEFEEVGLICRYYQKLI